MARLLLIVIAAAVFVAIVAIMVSAWTAMFAAGQRASRQVLAQEEGGLMGPEQLRKLAYVALILVLFGVSSGWLGGM